MNYKKFFRQLKLPALALAVLALAATPSFAAEYWLCAQSGNLTMPDSAIIPMCMCYERELILFSFVVNVMN